MNKPKLLIFSQQFSNCPLSEIIFKNDFRTEVVETTEELRNKINKFNPDAIIAGFCKAEGKDIAELSILDPNINLVPLIYCSRGVISEVVFAAAQKGADYFINCLEEKEKIVNIINKIIQQGGIKRFFKACYPDSFSLSPYITKIVKIIISAFPKRLNENEFAEQLGVSERQLRVLSRQVFKINFNKLIRRLWIYQAIRLMKLTNFDNTEIALLLNYSEEGSMARDFHKELGYTPKKALKFLLINTPEDMLKL